MKHGNAKKGAKTSLYNRWVVMRQRCNNPNSKDYEHYGGRGIQVCAEWSDFERFREWAVSNGYADGLMLDRKDNNGNYEPSNCRWVDYSTNEFNRRIFKNNKTGATGVYKRGEKYVAYIDKNKKRAILGTFETLEQAVHARKQAEQAVWKNEVEIVEYQGKGK